APALSASVARTLSDLPLIDIGAPSIARLEEDCPRFGFRIKTPVLLALPQNFDLSSAPLHFQQLTRSARLWNAPDREWLRARSNNFLPSGLLVKTSCTGPTSLFQRRANWSANSFLRPSVSGTEK